MTLRNLFRVSACTVLLGLCACPSPCERGCNQMDYCAHKLYDDGIDMTDCLNSCGKNTCVNRDEVYDCYAVMDCDNTLSYLLEAGACAAKCKTK